MKFRTELNAKKSQLSINYSDSILLIGSCFSSNIGKKLELAKFNTQINPFGVVYNPVSIFNTLSSIISEKTYTNHDLFFKNDLYQSFDFHSSFSFSDKSECIDLMNSSVKESYKFLCSTSKIIITLGTSFVYKLNETNQIVSNCHKVHQNEFTRYRLSLNETTKYLSQIVEILNEINSNIEIVFTVSPIRHLSDGFEENQRSKSTLVLAIDETLSTNKNCDYFPSYEILMDDLRDYRFYKDDLTHPNTQAIDYIWEKFSDNYFNIDTKNGLNTITKIIKASKHRAFNIKTEKHQKFIKAQLSDIDKLNVRFSTLCFKNEIDIFKNQLT